MRFKLFASAVALLSAALESDCGGPLNLGTDILWSTNNETGDLSAWQLPPGSGGTYTNSGDATVAISTSEARSGRYSIKFSSAALSPMASPDTPGGGGIYKEGPLPQNAFYSVWYFLPRTYQTTTSWTILSFKLRQDATTVSPLIDLRLRSSPSGQMTLVLYDHRPQYLAAPLPNPPPTVPIGRWFQIESFYRNASDASGHLTVWLDGALAYDFTRPTGSGSSVYFSPCSLVNALSPPSAEIYVDDVAVSASRIGPNGMLTVPQ